MRRNGNDDVTMVVLPGLDHYFNPVSSDPARRVWERVSLEALRRPMAVEALEPFTDCTTRILCRPNPS